LVLTPDEQNVSDADVAALEQAKAKRQLRIHFESSDSAVHSITIRVASFNHESGLRKSGQFMKLSRQIFAQEEFRWMSRGWARLRAPETKSNVVGCRVRLVAVCARHGRQFGLRQTAWIDERNSFEQATRASAKYLKSLAAHYDGNWELAMAAYNTGAGNVDRAVRAPARRTSGHLSLHCTGDTQLRSQYPGHYTDREESRENMLQGYSSGSGKSYDVVQVPTATSLQLVADATDSNLDYIRSLNPN